jgi:hypothetical protein
MLAMSAVSSLRHMSHGLLMLLPGAFLDHAKLLLTRAVPGLCEQHGRHIHIRAAAIPEDLLQL